MIKNQMQYWYLFSGVQPQDIFRCDKAYIYVYGGHNLPSPLIWIELSKVSTQKSLYKLGSQQFYIKHSLNFGFGPAVLTISAILLKYPTFEGVFFMFSGSK